MSKAIETYKPLLRTRCECGLKLEDFLTSPRRWPGGRHAQCLAIAFLPELYVMEDRAGGDDGYAIG